MTERLRRYFAVRLSIGEAALLFFSFAVGSVIAVLSDGTWWLGGLLVALAVALARYRSWLPSRASK